MSTKSWRFSVGARDEVECRTKALKAQRERRRTGLFKSEFKDTGRKSGEEVLKSRKEVDE